MRDGFVYRYSARDGGRRPAAGAKARSCSARSGWRTSTRCRAGVAEARALFERLLSIRNDVGLLAEEYDPSARRLLGNFPQAFSHIGLVNTARNIWASGGPAEERRKA